MYYKYKNSHNENIYKYEIFPSNWSGVKEEIS